MRLEEKVPYLPREMMLWLVSGVDFEEEGGKGRTNAHPLTLTYWVLFGGF